MIGYEKNEWGEKQGVMETLEILDAVQTLPAGQKMFIAEKIIKSLRKKERRALLKHADGDADFLKLFGAIKDETFVEPDDVNTEYDIHKEPL
ncbi:MAG: hypothetical protein LBK66_06945 [Spirochaetaceae bacterium]|jgi:hypothetical protein|nr:hypothetical protein [Spirochaetaceae bacterium]